MAFKGWEKTRITLDNGDEAEAIAPVIVSASRSTDIPAFYGEWFVERYKRGYITWVNPFNGLVTHVSFAKARAVVFWTKYPRPFLKHLAELDPLQPNYLFQFTLNDYEREGLEPGVPALAERVATFGELAARLGPERVVWRFDPLLLSDSVTVTALAGRVRSLAEQLSGSTRQLVISFVDIGRYPSVKRNLATAGATAREFTGDEIRELASSLKDLPSRYGIAVSTCAEEADLREFGIGHSRCIDDRLLRRVFGQDRDLLAFLGPDEAGQTSLFETNDVRRHPLKDKGQRPLCGCVVSKDIGRYDTCGHGCLYCYANSSVEAVARNRAAMGRGFPCALGAPPGT